MRWFASSERAAGVGAEGPRKAFLASSVGLGLLAAASVACIVPAWAQTVASPSPSPAPEWLNLPAADLSPVAPPSPIRVGDSLVLEAAGVDPAHAVAAETLPAETLTDQGWAVGPAAKPANGDPAPSALRFEAYPLKAGSLTLPSLPIRDASGNFVARTNPYTAEIASAISPKDEKPSEPVPMRPPVGLAFPWWLAAVAGVITLALLVGLVFLAKKYLTTGKPAAFVAPPKPILPEDAEALAALSALELENPLRSGKFKVHYFRLSEILKTYLGRRYRFDALESTSSEIIAALDKRQNLDEVVVDRFEALFEKLDLVKFTDHVPAPAEGPDLLREARDLVTTTRRKVEAPLVSPAKGSV